PNMVMAYDADEADAGHFLVMEFVRGRDLAACLQQDGPFSIRKALHCIEQAARGLAFAHSRAIVHRDIKPHNLLLDASGVVKITDLGLARLTHDVETTDSEATAVTKAGGVLGTVDYMAPEQALDSTAIDHRADIYSLGCTLHFLLTGRPPYGGATLMAILLKHRDAPIPRLSELRPDIPARLENLFQRMLAKDPSQRIQSMTDVADECVAIDAECGGDQSASDLAPHEQPDLFGPGSSSSTIAIRHDPAMTIVLQPSTDAPGVLLVESSRVQASIIRSYLESTCCKVTGVVSTGRDAIELVRTHRPRAVVCALHLPDMSGLQLAELMRADADVTAPGFVLITSETGEVAAESLVKLRRVLPLTKPFTPEDLKAAIDSVIEATADRLTVSMAESPLKLQGRIDRRQARVLLVDDSGAARKYLRASLEEMGFTHFMEVADGAQAIAMSARAFCDLIVTDYNMPLMDGRALVSYFKQNPATAGIPIIMVTTEADPRKLESVRQLGVTAIVEKHFPKDVVIPILDALF
ncbi:MAG: protein kinase domain-containing protein, partial [Planctomycetota bacterium]